MKIRNIFLSLSLVVLLGASALAQTGNDVSIKLINKEGKVVATSNLDAKGNFNFPDLAPGDYTMKVSVQDFHFLKIQAIPGDKGTNGQNSTGKFGIKENGVKKNEAVAIAENTPKPADKIFRDDGTAGDKIPGDKVSAEQSRSHSNFFLKIDGIQGVAASDYHIKFQAVSAERKGWDGSIKGGKPEVQLDSWSWGASNSLTYVTEHADKLTAGVEVQFSTTEKKNYVGHVTIVK